MVDKKEEPYREGCDDSLPQEKESAADTEESLEEDKVTPISSSKEDEQPTTEDEQMTTEEEDRGPLPDTVFLVVRHLDGRIEAATNLPGFKSTRVADLRDIRDISHALYTDVSTTIHAKITAREAAAGLQQAMMKNQISKMTQNLKKH